MERTVALLLLLLSTSCVRETPRPDPPPDPAPVVTPTPSPSRLPVERERRRFVAWTDHRFKQDEYVRLDDGGEGEGVRVYRDVQAWEATDTKNSVVVAPGTYAETLTVYKWIDNAIGIRIITGDHARRGQLSLGVVWRRDVMWLDGKKWRR